MNAPVRKLIKPTTPRTVHLLHLSALESPVQAEATTEADFVCLAALCPAVRSIVSQPCTLDLDGHQFTPDFRVECDSGACSYWEVKLEARFSKYRTLFTAAAGHLQGRGEHFYAISNVSLRQRNQHKLARLLDRYGKARPKEADVERVLREARSRSAGFTAAELATRAQVAPELIYHLLARRQLSFKKRIGIGSADPLIHPQYLEKQDDLLLASWFDVSPWHANAGANS
ncbi:MAG TPA: hypothetical protein VGM81_14275 [Burkholderiaceae bacterium]|jgi:hypothetical protein